MKKMLSEGSLDALVRLESTIDHLREGDYDGAGYEIRLPEHIMDFLLEALHKEVQYLKSTEKRPRSRWITKAGAPPKVGVVDVGFMVWECATENPPLSTAKIMDSIIGAYDVDERTAHKAILSFTKGKDPDEYFAFENYMSENPPPNIPLYIDYSVEKDWIDAMDDYVKRFHRYRHEDFEEYQKNKKW